MPKLQEIKETILHKGRVDSTDLELLRSELYANGKIDRRAADFLAELHKRVEHRSPAFDHFFYRAMKDHLLADGKINGEESAWLRQLIFFDGRITDEARKFMHELKGEAHAVSPEFEKLFHDAEKQPRVQHTCG